MISNLLSAVVKIALESESSLLRKLIVDENCEVPIAMRELDGTTGAYFIGNLKDLIKVEILGREFTIPLLDLIVFVYPNEEEGTGARMVIKRRRDDVKRRRDEEPSYRPVQRTE